MERIIMDDEQRQKVLNIIKNNILTYEDMKVNNPQLYEMLCGDEHIEKLNDIMKGIENLAK